MRKIFIYILPSWPSIPLSVHDFFTFSRSETESFSWDIFANESARWEKTNIFFAHRVSFCSILSFFSFGIVHILPRTKRIRVQLGFVSLWGFFYFHFSRFILFFNTRSSRVSDRSFWCSKFNFINGLKNIYICITFCGGLEIFNVLNDLIFISMLLL